MKRSAFAFALFALSMRGDAETVPHGGPRPPPIYARELPEDVREQARNAFVADAYRREARFRAAISDSNDAHGIHLESDLGDVAPAAVFDLGGRIFNHTFVKEEGFGAADLPPIARFHRGRRGGPDARSCATCHSRGGPAGGGDAADNAYFDGDGETQASAFGRNPKSLVGAGVVEILAREMSGELALGREAAIREAKTSTRPVRRDLVAKGVSFGSIVVRDGKLDTSLVRGVDADLVVKPFGWKGTFSNLRDIVEESLLVHHGLESNWLVTHAEPARVGAFGKDDPDGDGVRNEVTEGQVNALTLYVAMQETPIVSPPSDGDQLAAYAEGRAMFGSLGCATCHTPSLTLDSSVYKLPGRSTWAPDLELDLAVEGAVPRVASTDVAGAAPRAVFVYSDFKRHDMGPELADARDDRGVKSAEFVTPPLWGVSRSRPYLHDGRAPDFDTAILMHGGEAKEARDKFAAMTDEARSPVRVFLAAMTRARRVVTR